MILVKVFEALNRRKVRYLVAGGVATVLYGNPRFTKDLDLFVDLAEENLSRMIQAFKDLKFIPRVPVKAEDFISEENRKRWMHEKGMLAFTFINPQNPFENVDILLHSPVAFDQAHRKRKIFRTEEVPVPTISIADLIVMKRKAGRPQDLQDIDILNAIQRRRRR